MTSVVFIGTSKERAADEVLSMDEDRKLSIPSKDIMPAALITKPLLQAASRAKDKTRRSTLEETPLVSKEFSENDSETASLSTQSKKSDKPVKKDDKGKPLENIEEEKKR